MSTAKQDAVWSALARRFEGQFRPGGFLGTSVLTVPVDDWTITLDTQTQSVQLFTVTSTRLRVPFSNPRGFRFHVHRKGLFSGIAELFGAQDVMTGDPEFDRLFVVKSTDAPCIRDLLDPGVRDRLMRDPRLYLAVTEDPDHYSGFNRLPEGVDELRFVVSGVVTEQALLEAAFDLFTVTLRTLREIDPGFGEAPAVRL